MNGGPGTPKTPGTPIHLKKHPLSDSKLKLDQQKSLDGKGGEVPNGFGGKGEGNKLIEAEKMETETVRKSPQNATDILLHCVVVLEQDTFILA